MYSAFAISNALLKQASLRRTSITPLRLQALLYLAQAAYQMRNGMPLFDDFFINGPGGPAVPAVDAKVRAYDGHPIMQSINVLSLNPTVRLVPTIPDDHHDEWSLVRALMERFASWPDAQMLMLVGGQDSAWRAAEPGSLVTTAALLVDAGRIFKGT